MKLIDTPNPNAKKILIDQNKEDIAKSLEELKSILLQNGTKDLGFCPYFDSSSNRECCSIFCI